MNPLLHIDEISLLATCRVEGTFGELYRALRRKGYTTGLSSLEENLPLKKALPFLEVVALTYETEHHRYETKRTPRSATGPDFKKILPSLNLKGKVSEVTLRLRPLPEKRKRIAFLFTAPHPFLQALAASGAHPQSIEKENFKKTTRILLNFEGKRDVVEAEIEAVLRLVALHKGRRHG